MNLGDFDITNYKIDLEVKNLIKLGIPSDLALIYVYAKHNKEELAKDLVYDKIAEQILLQEELQKFTPFMPYEPLMSINLNDKVDVENLKLIEN
jgi:hypothetical protein